MKMCIRCKELKDLSKFENHSTSKDGKRNQCSSCRYKIRLEREPNYYNKQRNWNLLKRYGITLEDYNQMLLDQNNVCAICQKQNDHNHKLLFVDHNHKTGALRGLLCHNCNIILGNAKDDPEILRAALAYLSR